MRLVGRGALLATASSHVFSVVFSVTVFSVTMLGAAHAQSAAPSSDLPAVTVDSPKPRVPQQTTPARTAQSRRTARRATRNTSHQPNKPTPAAANTSPARETAWGPVQGFVATRSATGTKTDTPQIENPQSISVVTQDMIRDTGAQTVSEALSYTAGVRTEPYGFDARYDQLMIRGFTANQYGYYVDGLRQGNGTFGFFRNEPYGLERIEVLRGPSSVLYGANEAGGMINLISKMPLETMMNEAGIDIGNFDRYQGHFDFTGPVVGNDKVLYRITGLFRDSGTQVPNTWDNRVFIAPSVTMKISDDTTLTVLSQYEKNKNSMWPYYLRIPGYGVSNIRVGDPAFDTMNQSQESIGYRLEHRFNNSLTFRQNLRAGHVDWTGNFVDADSLVTPTTLARYAGQFSETLSTFNLDNQLEAKIATGSIRHTILTGVDYFWQSADLSQSIGGASSLNLLNPVYGNATVGPFTKINATYQTVNQTGIYAQDQMALGGWRLTLGGREDFADLASTNKLLTSSSYGRKTSSDPNAFTGRAGLLYLFDSGLAPYVNYATSFLPQTGVSAPQRGAQAFAPTKGESFEAGVKYQPKGSNSYLTATWYNLTKDNVLTTDPLYGSLYSVQTGQIRSRGVELEAVASLTSGLKGIASYTYTDAKVTQSNGVDFGKVPVAVPTNQAAIFVDYTWHKSWLAGFGAGIGYRYIGENWADNINTIRNPAINAIDAGVHYDYGIWRLAVNGRNIFDKRQGICNYSNCTISQGRTVLGSLSARW